MNKASKELLDKTIELKNDERLPLFKGIYIIQQRKLHDSGYRMMYVIGHTKYDGEIRDYHYYLVGTYSDVIDFTPTFNKFLSRNYDMCDLHLDIDKNGLIHIWTNSDKYFKCCFPFISSCSFEILGDKEIEEIPQFKGTLEELDNLTLGEKE